MPASLDEEPDRSENRDDRGDDRDGGVERDARIGELVAVEAARDREEHGSEREQADEHELADQPRAVPLRGTSFHIPLIGRRAAADETCMESILIADDHPLTREALASLLGQHGFDVVGQASDGAGGDRRGRQAPPEARPPRSDDARHGRADRAAAHSRGVSRERGRRAHGLGDGREPPGGDPSRRGRLPPEERAAGAHCLVPPRRRATARQPSRARSPAACSTAFAKAAAWAACPTRSRRSSPPARSRCCLLLDEHLGTDEIAARLYISEHTVRSHVKSLLRKLGVSSRRDALERLATARR